MDINPWPGRTTTKIGYGHDGALLPLNKTELITARQKHSGVKFYDTGFVRTLIPSKTFINYGSELPNYEKRSWKRHVAGITNDSYFPPYETAEIMREGAHVMSALGYDPSIGSLLDVDTRVVAYVDSKTDTNVMFSELGKRNLIGNGESIPGPDLNLQASADTGSTIKGISLCHDGTYGVVRTALGTNVYSIGDDFSIEKGSSVTGTHVDSVMSPWDSRLAISDEKGQISLYSSGKLVSEAAPPDTKTTQYEWNRLVWNNHNSIITANRKHVYGQDFRSGAMTYQVLDTDMFTKVCDIRRFDDSNDLFILTNSQLMWYDTRNLGRGPVLAWDHFVDSRDLSLRMSTFVYPWEVNHMDRVMLIGLYSQMIPATLFYQFGVSEVKSLPVSPQDPFYCRSPPDSVTQTQHMLPLSKDAMALLRVSTDLSVSYQVLHTSSEVSVGEDDGGEGDEIQVDDEEGDEIQAEDEEDGETEEEDDHTWHRKRTYYEYYNDYRRFYQSTFNTDITIATTEAESQDIVQNIANQIGERIRDEYQDPKCKPPIPLLKLVDSASLPDLDELESMISQLQTHYSGTAVDIKKLGVGSIFDPDTIASFSDIIQYLDKGYIEPIRGTVDPSVIERRVKHVHQIAMDMALSTVALHIDKTQPEPQSPEMDPISRYSKISANLSAPTKTLLDEWIINENPNDYIYTKFGESREQLSPMSTQPDTQLWGPSPVIPSSPPFMPPSSLASSPGKGIRPSQKRRKAQKTRKRTDGFA